MTQGPATTCHMSWRRPAPGTQTNPHFPESPAPPLPGSVPFHGPEQIQGRSDWSEWACHVLYVVHMLTACKIPSPGPKASQSGPLVPLA